LISSSREASTLRNSSDASLALVTFSGGAGLRVEAASRAWASSAGRCTPPEPTTVDRGMAPVKNKAAISSGIAPIRTR